jgi:transposase
MNILKQVIGIDVSKSTLIACYGTLNSKLEQTIGQAVSFDNDTKGHKAFLSWAQKSRLSVDVPLWFVMEATGVYYENLAYFLAENEQQLTVLLPNKAKNYAKTLDNKSKTDKLDASTLTRFGLEKQLKKWQIPNNLLKTLKSLSREYQTIKAMATQVKNQLHAKEHSYKPPKETIKRAQQQLRLYNQQLKEIEKQIKDLVEQDSDFNDKIQKIQKIEGVGFMTIVTIISETNGFALIENYKQLTSYAGLDVVHNQSGQSQRKTRISKKGNKFIRAALYMPALCACKYNEKLKQLYIRLVIRKNFKKIAIIAVARKLLILIYTLWKKNIEYVPNYQRT